VHEFVNKEISLGFTGHLQRQFTFHFVQFLFFEMRQDNRIGIVAPLSPPPVTKPQHRFSHP